MPYRLVDTLLDIALAPALWLGVLIALIYSLLFTLWRGGGWRQAPKDLLAGLVGFGSGHLIAGVVHLDLLRVGQLRLLGATLGAAIALLAGRVIVRRLRPVQPRVPAKGRTTG
jgi:hypothetical protein